jgi:PAS domain S-box-containing protein
MAVSLHHLTDDLRVAAAEEARLRARLESVFASVTEAVVATDARGRVTDLNRAAAELLGIDPPEAAHGRALDDVVVLEGPDGHPMALTAAGDRPRPVGGHVRAGADVVPVLGTVAPLTGGGERSGVVVVLRDIRQEQALESAKQDFLATIGHELRTPLTPIKGYAGLLRRRPPTPEQAHSWADGITAGVERLVTFAAVTAGAGAAAPVVEDLDPDALVEEVGRDWRDRLAGDREVVVAPRTEGRRPVRGDAAQLKLALGELVDNAARFSPPGTPIVVRAAAVPDDDSVVALSVEDAGGDGGAAFEDLVGAFQQGEAAATRVHDGLGLGLALTDRIARAHGGDVAIATSHAGTVVSILVPVVTGRARQDDER